MNQLNKCLNAVDTFRSGLGIVEWFVLTRFQHAHNPSPSMPSWAFWARRRSFFIFLGQVSFAPDLCSPLSWNHSSGGRVEMRQICR
jgi:hypothetical protein